MNFERPPKKVSMEEQVERLRRRRKYAAARKKKRGLSDGGKVRIREFSADNVCEVCEPPCDRQPHARGQLSRRWVCHPAYRREWRLRRAGNRP
jgi:hypothetical protein